MGRSAVNVDRYEIYNIKGEQVLEFEQPGEDAEKEAEAEREHENLSEHKPHAFRRILAGEVYVESFEEIDDGKPRFISEGVRFMFAPIFVLGLRSFSASSPGCSNSRPLA